MDLKRQLTRLLVRMISLSPQHGTKKRGHTRDSNPPSQCSSGRRHFMPWTAQTGIVGLLEKDLRLYSYYQNWGLQNQRELEACFHTNLFRVANRYLRIWSCYRLLLFLGQKISLQHQSVVCDRFWSSECLNQLIDFYKMWHEHDGIWDHCKIVIWQG
jgi:hypothetical protein